MNHRARLLLFLLLVVSAPAQAAVEWSVLASDDSGVTVRVRVDGAILDRGEDGVDAIRLGGAHLTGSPGEPALPADARWIAVPPGATPRLRILSSRIDELGTARLAPVPTPELRPEGAQGPRLIEARSFGETYDRFRSTEQDAAVLSAPVHQRRQRVVSLGVSPVLYDAASGRVQLVAELELRVEWSAPSLVPDVPARPDDTILRTVLNPEQARVWAGHSPRHASLLEAARRAPAAPRAPAVGIQTFDPLSLVADGIRLRVERTGIVRVTVADLIAEGGLPDDVPRSWLRVVQMRGSEPGTPGYPAPLAVDVPVHFFGRPDESGNLSNTDEIYFHALRVEDDADTLEVGADRALPALPWGESRTTDQIPPRYTGDHYNGANVYWVYLAEPPAGGWARMEAVVAPASGGNPAASYRRVDHFEGNQGVRDEPFDRWVERYAWNRRDEVDMSRALRMYHPVPGGDLEVRWAAGEHIVPSTIPVDFSLRQDATELPLSSIDLTHGGVMTNWSRTLASPGLQDGVVEFRMRRLFNGSDVGVNSFLDHVQLEYDGLFLASGDELRFSTGSTAGVADVEVEGYTRGDLLCFDVTDPRAPRWIDLQAANVEDRSGGGPSNFALSLQLAQASGEERVLTASPRVRYTRIGRAGIERDPVADLFSEVGDAQVLAIGPEAFRSQMERWIAWREQTYADAGWNFAYVDVQQIYDHFSGGLQSPWAIRDFAEWAWLQWDSVALVIVGDASEDPLNAAGRAGPHHVPTPLHLQSFSGIREIVGSDKWYGVFGYQPPNASAHYPDGLDVTSDLVVGRFPVADATELGGLIDKIIAYEQTAPDAPWRRQTLWVSDDSWSTDLIGAGSGCYSSRAIEDDFRQSQLASAELTTGSLDSTVTGVLLNADEYTSECRVGVTCENLTGVRQCYLAEPVRRFLSRWSEGWLWLSYQGHAAYNVLGHENLLLAQELGSLRNDGRPWVFFGMACHVSDFIRFEEAVDGRSLGELLLFQPNRGAIATYASTAFEFLTPNAVFMETLAETMFERSVPESPVFGTSMRNQWILGDVMARGELETLALRATTNIYRGDEMIAQYLILGDPLLRMDAAAPRLQVSRGGAELPGGSVIAADPSSSSAAIDLTVVDESGLDRVEITDDEGRDYGGVVPALTGADPRRADLSVDLPVYPQTYSVEIAGFDAARPELRRTVVALKVELAVDFFVDGEAVAPGSLVTLQPGVPRAMRVELSSPVDLLAEEIELDYAGVDLTGVSRTGSGRDWSVSFDALLQEDSEPGALNLVLRGVPTELATSGTGPAGAPPVVLQHAVFPNPVQNRGRVVVQVEGAVDRARLSVYDLAGNEVGSSELLAGSSAPHQERGTSISFEFETRDRRGDELANGTYFYRIRVEGPTGSARSDMGRLLIMR